MASYPGYDNRKQADSTTKVSGAGGGGTDPTLEPGQYPPGADHGIFGGPLNFGAVLVGAGDVPDVVAFLAVVAGQDVALNELHGIADVRWGVGIGGGGGDVEGVWHDFWSYCTGHGSTSAGLRLDE